MDQPQIILNYKIQFVVKTKTQGLHLNYHQNFIGYMIYNDKLNSGWIRSFIQSCFLVFAQGFESDAQLVNDEPA